MLYNSKTFEEFCIENKVDLLENYLSCVINRETVINGKCKTEGCENTFHKTFRQLVETKNYCHNCSIENGKQKYNQKCKYNLKFLNTYCEENKITLLNDYANSKTNINRDTRICGNCINVNCQNNFNKSFRELIIHNGYCFHCCKEIGKSKILQTNINKYGYEPTINIIII